MACCPEGTPRQREGTHAAARRHRRRTPAASLGESRKELRLRFAERQEESRRPVRWPKPAYHLSLHVRSRLAGRLPELLVQYGPYRWWAGASCAARCLVCSLVPGANREDRCLPDAIGMEVPLGLVLRQ